MTSGWRILVVVGIHFLINLLTAFVFFVDDYSILYQTVHSIIHIASFLVIVNWIYYKDEGLRLTKKAEKYFVIIFLVLNVIPFRQELKLADNGFVPMWSQYPQVNFGMPNTYLRFFDVSFYEFHQLGDGPVLHLNLLFFNLYLLAVLAIVLIFIKKRMS